MKKLTIGSRGAEVKQLQQQLNHWGIKTTIDGIFGPATEKGVKLFQSKRTNGVAYASQNLTVDGIVGDQTWAELTKTPVAKLSTSSHHPQIWAFLQMIRIPEGTEGENGYRTMFTGRLFTSFNDHPRLILEGSGIRSDAAGAYQFLSTTWDSVASDLGLTDFSPANQDLGAIELIRRRGAYEDVIEGRILPALEKTSWEWASLPPGRYGQPSITFQEAIALFIQFGGIIR